MRTLHAPFGEPSFAREFRNISRYEKLGIPELEAAFFGQRKVNGEVRQQGDLAQMSWKVAEVIAAVEAEYPTVSGLKADCYVCRSTDGACRN